MAKHRDPHLDWSTVNAELEAQQYGDEGWGKHRDPHVKFRTSMAEHMAESEWRADRALMERIITPPPRRRRGPFF